MEGFRRVVVGGGSLGSEMGYEVDEHTSERGKVRSGNRKCWEEEGGTVTNGSEEEGAMAR